MNYDMNKEPSHVYILTSTSFREDWVKIGKSSRPVDVRREKVIGRANVMILKLMFCECEKR